MYSANRDHSAKDKVTFFFFFIIRKSRHGRRLGPRRRGQLNANEITNLGPPSRELKTKKILAMTLSFWIQR